MKYHSIDEKEDYKYIGLDGQKKDMISFLLVFLSPKEEVEMDEAISHSPEKEQGELLNIVGDPGFG